MKIIKQTLYRCPRCKAWYSEKKAATDCCIKVKTKTISYCSNCGEELLGSFEVRLHLNRNRDYICK